MNHRGPVRILWQQADHRIDEKVGTLLVANAPEAADRKSPRQLGAFEVRVAFRRGAESFAVHSVLHDDVGHGQELPGTLAGGDDGIHTREQEAREPRVMSLCRRGEDEFQRRSQHKLENHAGQHLDIAARVPDAKLATGRPLQETGRLPPGNLREVARQAGSEGGDTEMLCLTRKKLNDRAGHAGESGA